MILPRLLVLTLGLLPVILNAQTRDPSLYGRAYLAEGDNAGAIENYQEATKINPFDPVALNNLAVARAAAGDYQAALDLLVRANKLAPNRPDISENYRQLQSWMNGQVRGTSNHSWPKPPAVPDTQLPSSNFGAFSEPPTLWQGTPRKDPRPIYQSLSREHNSSFAPKKKKKKAKRNNVLCAPRVTE